MSPERIRKLLAHADDRACSPAEAAAFRAKAEHALSQRRRVERAYATTTASPQHQWRA